MRTLVRLRHPDYFAAPVPAWGSRRARLLIIGLAPGMHGANRTGRPFCGDASGAFLFAALERGGFAARAGNGFRLANCRITNAVRCLPPDNLPSRRELDACGDFLKAELADLWRPGARSPRAVLALGQVAYQAVGRALGKRLAPFAHGVQNSPALSLSVSGSYHPSRLNVNTGRLTAATFDAVLAPIGAALGTRPRRA